VGRLSHVLHTSSYPLTADENGTATRRAVAGAVFGALALAGLSLAVVAPAPTYDPWSWLLWGKEIVGGDLSTTEGPSFKPLAVFACAPLALLGPSVAPWAWVLIARVGALLALWLTFRLARRLAGGSVAAGVLASVAVALCGAYLLYASAGMVTGWLLALALAGVEAWRAGRHRLALACAVGCALLHVEAWPFAAATGLLLWRDRPRDRPLLALCALGVPALWFVPELLGSGDLLRSAERARIPNPGQPALAEVPAVASVDEAARLLLWPLWVGVLALLAVRWRRPGDAVRQALAPAIVGVAWVALVAVMAQLGGFSGEPRYALPGMALIAVSGAVGLVTAGRGGAGGLAARPSRTLALLAVAGLTAVAALPRLDALAGIPAAQSHQWALATELPDAIAAAGGRAALRACGEPYVGRLRGPLLAYGLEVHKHEVEPDRAPQAPAVVFRSRLAPDAPTTPAVSSRYRLVAKTGAWQVRSACKVRMP
jgi:hypothetical protein